MMKNCGNTGICGEVYVLRQTIIDWKHLLMMIMMMTKKDKLFQDYRFLWSRTSYIKVFSNVNIVGREVLLQEGKKKKKKVNSLK